jgi:hypothetical protein
MHPMSAAGFGLVPVPPMPDIHPCRFFLLNYPRGSDIACYKQEFWSPAHHRLELGVDAPLFVLRSLFEFSFPLRDGLLRNKNGCPLARRAGVYFWTRSEHGETRV